MAEGRWARWSAVVVVAGAGLWVIAGVLIVWPPAALPTGQAYSTLVPAALVALLAGAGGLGAWLGGWVEPVRQPAWRHGLASALLAMSSDRYEVVNAVAGSGGDHSGLSARRIGVAALRLGSVAVVAATLLLQGQPGAARSLLFLGWFVFFCGAMTLGIGVLTSGHAPRWAGALVLAGSVLVLSPIATALAGAGQRPEMLGPLLPSADGGLVISLVPWLLFGAGCAWLGVALWSAGGTVRRGAARRAGG